MRDNQGDIVEVQRAPDVDIMLPCPVVGYVCDHPATCNCSICDRILKRQVANDEATGKQKEIVTTNAN